MKKVNYLTVLSVISCIFVVVIHCNFAFFGFSYSRYWKTATILRSITYPAVPIFFMISGATLIDYKKRYDTKTFFIKRIKKVLIPFIAWGIIGLAYCLLMNDNGVKISDLSFKYILNGILNYKFQDVYWFFPVLLSIYLVIPVLANVQNKKKIFAYIAILYFVFECLYPFVNNVFKLGISIPIKIYILKGYLFYVVVGYLLHNIRLNKKYRYFFYLFGIVGFLLLAFGTMYLSLKHGKIVETFSGYLNVPCIMYAISIFIFIKSVSNKVLKNSYMSRFMEFFKKYTFSIYLLHNFVRHFLVVKFNISTISIIWRTVGIIPIIMLCIIITYLLRRIKYIRFIVPE